MVGSEMLSPEFVETVGEAEACVELAVSPLIPDPVDEQLTGPRVIALLCPGRTQMGANNVVNRPVLRVVRLSTRRPGSRQDLVHLMTGRDLLLLSHLGADHSLHEPVDLQ